MVTRNENLTGGDRHFLDDMHSDIQRLASLRASLRRFEVRQVECCRRLGTRPTEYRFLLALAAGLANQGIEPSAGVISKVMGLAPSTTSGLISSLTSRGYVSREIDSEDPRIVRLKVTEEGQRILRPLVSGHLDAWDQLLDDVDRERRR